MIPNTTAILLAGGRSERMEDDKGPKAFRMLGGRAVYRYSFDLFYEIVKNIVLVLDPPFSMDMSRIDYHRLDMTPAGETRDESLRNGIRCMLECFPGTTHFFVHDAARPFVTEKLIHRLFNAMEFNKAKMIAPALRITETIKHLGVSLSRGGTIRVQTPVLCNIEVAKFVDDHSLMESHSITDWVRTDHVDYIDGDPANFKITTPFDWKVAELIVKSWA